MRKLKFGLGVSCRSHSKDISVYKWFSKDLNKAKY